MDQFIHRLNQAKKNDFERRTYFNPRKGITLRYVREEPDGWPLTRPATRLEWAHALKALIMRRVPATGTIHKAKLIMLAQRDLISASDKGKLYVGPDFSGMRRLYILADIMIRRDGTLGTGLTKIEDPEMRRHDYPVYRTGHAEGWLKRIPVTVQALVDYLPTTNPLDLLVQALVDEESDQSPPDTPPS